MMIAILLPLTPLLDQAGLDMDLECVPDILEEDNGASSSDRNTDLEHVPDPPE